MARLSLLVVLLGLLVAGCGDGPAAVPLGGASVAPSTVERPWGTVRTFPTLQRAEIPREADMVFAAEMVVHHRQALDLTRNLLVHEGVDERVAAAARFIEQDQRAEITTMQRWIDSWTTSLPELAHHVHAHGAGSMPGMVPQAEVDRLRSLETPEAEASFLRLMVEHHEGAIAMSEDYLGNDHNSFTRSIARHVVREQTVEVTYLLRLIDGR
ncbi:DUF305 domain-containing protein [Mumia sp. DW29H23]|uniref:DUF305 domain-containing protein n=1 Tax=Mumia sp. DW29H23 TaxID=3421241 RepID=UPI003D69D04C